ncbi:TetR/AcrR family transcriptional regulator [Mesorhizobium sp. B2-1-8]|uniref:TetR/AcrR family transcriptional regulator n=1 Tax=Mesorhizobium sp. B2-1-8 TaxID=2589967 RepID=UPI0015E41B13|nr:TetR/AcrR family transcriptional regulator [Mesorhizobium sp. B2-1-8]UCI19937.1 TetR/AcrR family transcriptional regulator [Mesorhizobium sp. B2-1-8]
MQKTTVKRSQGRMGRPPRALAGEVDDRILDAARDIFLVSGLAGASIDEIARRARAGKPTIYARYPTKEALFAAVIMHNAARVQAAGADERPTGGTIKDRLTSVGTAILKRLLSGDTIDFMRLSAAEAQRFPELTNVGRTVRERAAQAATHVLREIASSDEAAVFPGLAPGRLETTTHFFLDLVASRFLLRALLGEPLDRLRADIDVHVAQAVSFFLSACRNPSNG